MNIRQTIFFDTVPRDLGKLVIKHMTWFVLRKDNVSNVLNVPTQIRAGEYEGLEEKLKKPDWAPDFGEAKFVPSWGGTVTGVRKFLIAYNVNMVCTKEQAHRCAQV